MSYHKVKDIDFAPFVLRDWYQPYALSADKIVDVFQEYGVVGLDILIHNRGASSLTVALDSNDAITVEAGDTFNVDNIKFCLVEVTSTVAYDMILAGRHLTKEQFRKVK